MSAVESGRKINVGLGRESSRGTSVAPTYWINYLEQDIVQQAEKASNSSALGVLDKNNAAEIMKEFAGGKISGKVCDRSFGLFLTAAFGASPSSAQQGSTGVYDHTFSQSQSNQPVALTVAVKDTNRDERYAFGSLKSLDLEIAVGDWVKYSADFISKKPTASAGNTVAYIAENEFKAKFVTVKIANDVASLGAAQAIQVKQGKISVDLGVEEYMAVGTNEPVDFFRKEVEFKGDLTLLYADNTYRDLALADGYKALQITLENTDVTIGSGAAHPKLVLTFPRVSLSDWGIDQGLSSMVEQTIGLMPLYSQTDGYTWTGVLTNTASSY